MRNQHCKSLCVGYTVIIDGSNNEETIMNNSYKHFNSVGILEYIQTERLESNGTLMVTTKYFDEDGSHYSTAISQYPRDSDYARNFAG